jgi:hypothetical protein
MVAFGHLLETSVARRRGDDDRAGRQLAKFSGDDETK